MDAVYLGLALALWLLMIAMATGCARLAGAKS